MPINLPIAVHAFIIKENQILLMKRANTGFNDDKWSVPAGRLEEGESFSMAAKREVNEEVGLSIKIEDLETPLIMDHKDSRGERIYVFYSIKKWSGEPKNMEPDKCREINWFDKNQLPENLIEHIRYSIIAKDEGLHYVEYGF